jgi:hypothetical protein
MDDTELDKIIEDNIAVDLRDVTHGEECTNVYQRGLKQDIAAHLQTTVREAEAVHLENYKWLLGLSGGFPLSEPGLRYNWRPLLRQRIPKEMLYKINKPQLKKGTRDE